MHFLKACVLLASLPVLARSLTIPSADMPVFYLVSSSTSASANLLPLRLAAGSGNGVASLTGTGAIGQFYFYQGRLTAYDPTTAYIPLINTQQTDVSTCAKSGALAFVQGGSTNKCASYSSFQIQSDTQNSQLGAQLVFNYVGGFYLCSNGQEVWYKFSADDGPSGCQPISLWTVPVA